jgi:hypothetical protein
MVIAQILKENEIMDVGDENKNAGECKDKC